MNPIGFFYFMLDLLQEPAIMIALIAFVGLLVQKSPFSDILKGTIKTSLGFLIIGIGSEALTKSLENFSNIFRTAFNVRGIIPNNEAIVGIAQVDFGIQMAMIMFFAFVVNILLARFTPFKYIFLTGHHTMFMAMLVTVVLSTMPNITGFWLVLIGSIVTGVLMVLMPAISQRYTKKITKTNDLAMGHFSTLSYIIAGFIGEKLGNKSKSTEDIQVPKSLLFLRDTPVAIAITMGAFFIMSSIIAGELYVSILSNGQNWLIFSFVQSLIFSGGVYIILQGVKMLISEIIPAFKGISEKIVPGAKPALDCPMVFPYAPNAVLIGFMSSFIAGLLVMTLQIFLGWTVIIPGVVAHFFLGATSGVYGNATGGRRGAILGSFVQGVLVSILPMFLLPALGNIGIESSTFSDMDFSIVGLILSQIVHFF